MGFYLARATENQAVAAPASAKAGPFLAEIAREQAAVKRQASRPAQAASRAVPKVD
jgi:hypothetical protein